MAASDRLVSIDLATGLLSSAAEARMDTKITAERATERANQAALYVPKPAVVPTITGTDDHTMLTSVMAVLVGLGLASDGSTPAGGSSPVWMGSYAPAGQVGVPYSFTYWADGVPSPLFTVTAGALPAGLTLNSFTGVLSGTPTTATGYSFTITARNSSGSITAPRTIAIAAAAVTGSVYGTGIGYDTKANVPIGPDGQKMAIRFKASTTSALQSVRFVQRGGPVYSAGSGGTMTITVRADDGSGHPSASVLSTATYVPGNPGGTWETYLPITFSSPATLTAGTIYYIVFEGSDTYNYISVNSVFTYNATTPRQPRLSDAEFGLMYTSGAWGALETGYTPVVDLAYANSVHDGQSYYAAMIDRYVTISGVGMAREQFTVTGGAKTVVSASIRVRRSSGTSPLTLTLETGAGSLIEAVTIPASMVPVSAPGGDNGGAVWVSANFGTARVLANGSTYNLRASAPAGTTYTTHPVLSAAAQGFLSYEFTDGTGQVTTDGSTWDEMYFAPNHADMQFALA